MFDFNLVLLNLDIIDPNLSYINKETKLEKEAKHEMMKTYFKNINDKILNTKFISLFDFAVRRRSWILFFTTNESRFETNHYNNFVILGTGNGV